jgi:hypothetical protein
MKITYKKLEPIVALLVLVCVVISCIYFVKYVHNQEEIKENCGWEQNETYYCYCDHDYVIMKQSEYEWLTEKGEEPTWRS